MTSLKDTQKIITAISKVLASSNAFTLLFQVTLFWLPTRLRSYSKRQLQKANEESKGSSLDQKLEDGTLRNQLFTVSTALTVRLWFSFNWVSAQKEQKVIELALEHWHNITCLNFERRDKEPKGNQIVFTDVDGCASNVGKHPLGEPQFVSLGPECIRVSNYL